MYHCLLKTKIKHDVKTLITRTDNPRQINEIKVFIAQATKKDSDEFHLSLSWLLYAINMNLSIPAVSPEALCVTFM